MELGLVTAKPSACLPVEADEPHLGHEGIDQEVLLQPVLPSPASNTTGKAQVRKREVTAMAEESFPTLITDFFAPSVPPTAPILGALLLVSPSNRRRTGRKFSETATSLLLYLNLGNCLRLFEAAGQ